MGRTGGKKRRQKKDSRYQFILTGATRCHFRGKTKADFTPIDGIPIMPRFNKDSLHYTPSFIIPLYYQQKSAREYLSSHLEKVRGTEPQSNTQILVPKPRSKSKYCSICQEHYSDYLEHVESEEHKYKLNSSNYHRHILRLCGQYEERNRRVGEQKGDRYQVRTETSTVSVDDNNII